MSETKGQVYLVGAGPGDPGLLTVRGLECLKSAQVLVYDGLVAREIVDQAARGCHLVYAGKKRAGEAAPLCQDEINALLIEHASAGKRVVRLKGGDPFVFGRGAEECLALKAAGIEFEVVPGVSAATAVPAYAGIPLTARGVSASAVLITGHEASDKSEGQVQWSAVSGNQTIVLFMAWRKIGECVAKILETGRDIKTPAAAIRWGTTPSQQTLVTTLGELPAAIAKSGIKPPMLVVIGEVVSMRAELDWFTSRPLFAKRIWITRPNSRANEVATELRSRGARAIVAATTCVQEASSEDAQALAISLAAAANYDWLVLTSANTVHACAVALSALGLDARALAGLRIAAVGSATSAALAKLGLRADLLASGGTARSLADDLLAGVETSALRVLYPRAEEGRDEAVTRLRAAGCTVDLRTAYRSAHRPASAPDLKSVLSDLRTGSLDAVAFFAPSQVEALCAMDPRALEYLARVPVLAAIGSTTAKALRSRGLTVHACAEQPNSKAMARAIVRAFATDSWGV